ncbi:GNAT family N-acetyltransferase [Stackebrandtia soli]|uniref:GNAT family N-acetyltransferase n=1 Tax=Stackebrandtia soli TaxID=1892856 RepID=UPI0039EA5873
MSTDGSAELRTDRLLMRPWTAADLAPFSEMNADPRVMEFFPTPLDRISSDAMAARIMARMEQRGWGLWALEVTATGAFIGFTGLADVSFEAHFTPATELAWRLARHAWGHGYVSEAAIAARDYAFDTLDRDEVVAFTAVDNIRSRAVMERIGMSRDEDDDFDHPLLPIGHRLRRHVLYRAHRPTESREQSTND